MEKKIFELVEIAINGKEDIMFKDFHIIETAKEDRAGIMTKKSFRVYHSKGYCFDITKNVISIFWDSKTNETKLETEYSLYKEWEGFKPISENEIVLLFLKLLKL